MLRAGLAELSAKLNPPNQVLTDPKKERLSVLFAEPIRRKSRPAVFTDHGLASHTLKIDLSSTRAMVITAFGGFDY
ncbi:hypothetical protein [Pseudomonas aeruginosa]|uniref:Uncharacterized protein n=1 Tax=Pseudomonas paraeruginosa TaxID=2994495 RepID=A0A2R3ILJ9_9PSED|nr:hypothetical protein [Pseudomonas aeruginosa]AVK02487.1 hypothetical protein CSB93_7115 [Pseudomonas paraeruginosa]AWE88864.1 hypothetical protein CSC28_7119 [Pseudomonas paraeruginosa]MCT9633948.1 hypothetical protein [Pseudomonas aeruginosa]